MMHGLALGLVLTSLLTAGFFAPAEHKFKHDDDDDNVIVKEGHRVVVVEYENNDAGNTKVSISPISDHKLLQDKLMDKAEDARESMTDKAGDINNKVKEASASVLPQIGKTADDEEEIRRKFSPTKLVCDAAGKSRRVIASAVGAADSTALSDAAGKVSGEVQETTQGVKDTVVGKAKDKFTQTKGEAYDSIKDNSGKAKHKLTETTTEAFDSIKEASGKAKEKLKETTGEAYDSVKDTVHKLSKKTGVEEMAGVKDMVWRWAAAASGVGELMGFAAAYGMCIWVTFASSYVLAGALPRQQFAMVQSRIYPVYFRATAYCLGMAVLGHVMRAGVWSLQSFNLAAALGMDLVNLVYLEPRATKVMGERMKKEKEGRRLDDSKNSTAEIAGRGREDAEMIMGLTARLQKLNSYSSLVNVVTLVSLTSHLVHLGQCVH